MGTTPMHLLFLIALIRLLLSPSPWGRAYLLACGLAIATPATAWALVLLMR